MDVVLIESNEKQIVQKIAQEDLQENQQNEKQQGEQNDDTEHTGKIVEETKEVHSLYFISDLVNMWHASRLRNPMLTRHDPDDSRPIAYRGSIAKVRSWSLQELSEMSMDELLKDMNARKRFIVLRNSVTNSLACITPDGVFDYSLYNYDTVDTDVLRKHIRENVTVATVADHRHAYMSRTTVKDNFILSIPYPVMQFAVCSDGTYLVRYKVPEHEEFFNSADYAYNISNYKYTMPALLFTLHISASFDVLRSAVKMILLDCPDPDAATVCSLPFPNVWTNGTICTGRTSLGARTACKSIGDACMRFTQLFLNSNWKNDLTPHNISSELLRSAKEACEDSNGAPISNDMCGFKFLLGAFHNKGTTWYDAARTAMFSNVEPMSQYMSNVILGEIFG